MTGSDFWLVFTRSSIDFFELMMASLFEVLVEVDVLSLRVAYLAEPVHVELSDER